MRLKVNRIKGFSFDGQRGITILKDGELFYQNAPKNGNPLTFNLPAGDYVVRTFDGILKVTKPLKYTGQKLPKPTVKRNKVDSFEPHELFGNNPNKCSVVFKRRPIFFWDRDFYKTLNHCEREFIKGHELGHYYYGGGEENEKNCDLYSIDRMMKLGYNPSQIYTSSEYTLSDESRKNLNEQIICRIDEGLK